ncbi:MAG: DUF937 domain-containing protein [Methylobacterium mesophilicum]|nr:DUF937 domain-containing protein [Methylobacterium mesophilicum]
MLPLWDMLMRAGGGPEAFARQFDLSQTQAQDALSALLPAFSEAFRRFTADPYGMGAFMSALASNQHAKYFEDAARAFTPQGIADGNTVVGQIFGSKELSRAIAEQAARATGLGAQVMSQMLPVIAAMLMGGFAKEARAAPQGGNPFADFYAQMIRQMGGAQPQAAANPWMDNPYAKAMEGVFKANPNENPWQKVFDQWHGGAKPQPSAPDGPENPYAKAMSQMFETGRKTQDEYLRGLQGVFDQFLKGMEKRP